MKLRKCPECGRELPQDKMDASWYGDDVKVDYTTYVCPCRNAKYRSLSWLWEHIGGQLDEMRKEADR